MEHSELSSSPVPLVDSKFVFKRLTPADNPEGPMWALKSIVYWMRALAAIVEDRGFTRTELEDFYGSVARRDPDTDASSNDDVDSKAFGALLMAQHYQAALGAFRSGGDLDPFVLSRSAIMTWYYVIYEASIAMVTAHGDFEGTSHRRLMNEWHTRLLKCSTPAVVGPFALHLDTLVPKESKAAIKDLRAGRTFRLTTAPTDYDEAWGAVCSYLSGTATRDRDAVEERLLRENTFENFLTKDARAKRDAPLRKKKVNFVDMAFRYRGKANYRDSLFLTYGSEDVHLVAKQSDEDTLRQYLVDLEIVGGAYLRMASTFVSKRVVGSSWDSFMADLDTHSRVDRHRW